MRNLFKVLLDFLFSGVDAGICYLNLGDKLGLSDTLYSIQDSGLNPMNWSIGGTNVFGSDSWMSEAGEGLSDPRTLGVLGLSYGMYDPEFFMGAGGAGAGAELGGEYAGMAGLTEAGATEAGMSVAGGAGDLVGGGLYADSGMGTMTDFPTDYTGLPADVGGVAAQGDMGTFFNPTTSGGGAPEFVPDYGAVGGATEFSAPMSDTLGAYWDKASNYIPSLKNLGLTYGLYNNYQNMQMAKRQEEMMRQREAQRQKLMRDWQDPQKRYAMIANDPAFQSNQAQLREEQRRALAAKGITNPLSTNYADPIANTLARNALMAEANYFNQMGQGLGMQFNPNEAELASTRNVQANRTSFGTSSGETSGGLLPAAFNIGSNKQKNANDTNWSY